jgi:hypothetical protein
MMPKKYTAKIIKKQRSNFSAYIMKIVSYMRDGHGHPAHVVLKSFPTFRSNDIYDSAKLKMFWLRVEISLVKFVQEGVMTEADADRIRVAYAAVIPLPSKPMTVPTAMPMPRTSNADLFARYPVLRT